MWLTELEADRLRNLRTAKLSLHGGLTVLVGPNGQGKTSLLEAVYLLAKGRSFRTRRIDELVAWDGGPLRVAGVLSTRVGLARLAVIVDGERRTLLADGMEREIEAFLGRLEVVDLTHERMRVLNGAPEERRRFLDRGLTGLDPAFVRVLGEYRRALAQRNALLRSGPGREAELRAWDERLVGAGTELHRRRREYAVRLCAELGEPTRMFLREGVELRLRYLPSPASSAEAEIDRFPELFHAALQKDLERDRTLGHTARGPHRDDLAIEVTPGTDLRRYGSAGQLRASMIALKLGKLSLVQKDRGDAPLFLMDDFDSDLDERRARKLAGFLHEAGFQALVATSKDTLASGLGVPCTRVRVENGAAIEE